MGPEWDESSRSSWVPAPSERVNEKCFQNDVSEMSPLLGEMTPQRKYQDSMLVIPSRVRDHPCGLVVFVVFDGFLSDWDWASHTHICLYIYIYIFFPPEVYLACPVTVLNRHFCCCCSLQRARSLSLPHPTKLWHSCPGHWLLRGA